MHRLMVLLYASLAIAAPQYNYQPAQNAPPSSVPVAPPSAGHSDFVAAPASAGSVGYASAPAPVSQGIVNKQFYIHSAPEEAFDEGASSSQESNTINKNLRVIIVKAPENKGLEHAALQLAKSASDSQTAIYVLTKQTDASSLQQKLSQLQGNNFNKPEVHFVKYKTPEEAQYAQQAIQNQYNSLPGPTQVSDEGVAPVENYGVGQQGGYGGQSVSGNVVGVTSNNYGSVSNSYLPVIKRI